MEPLREVLSKAKRGQRQASLERSDGELGLQEGGIHSVSQSPPFPWWAPQVAAQHCGPHTVVISKVSPISQKTYGF